MKNYYELLGVEKDCDENDLRRKYRKLAMKYHPDHNPDDPAAQEKFKEIAEAYGVLSDPEKRKQYDLFIASGGTNFNGANGGFSYSQEEIFRDLFNDPQFQQMFRSILTEFQKAGLRSSPTFVKKSFFNGKGGLFIGGLFMFGSLAGKIAGAKIKQKLPERDSFMRSMGQKFGKFLGYGDKAAQVESSSPSESGDIAYTLELSKEELVSGKTVEISIPRPDGEECLKVTVPAGSRAGQKLRLKGKGEMAPAGRGHLYLELAAVD